MKFIVLAKLRMTAIVAGSMLAGSLITGTAFAYEGHMVNALHALQAARQQLVVARPDGGYRAHAIGLVDDAIATVNEGIHAGY